MKHNKKILIPLLPFLTVASLNATESWTTGAYQNNEHIEKKLSIPHAEELIVTISGETEKYYDFIIIKNSENKKINKLSGKMNKHFKVEGNSITAILDSDYSITKSGVTVTIKDANPVDDDNSNKALTKNELKELIKNYCENPTAENKRAIEEANTSQITDMSSIFTVDRWCSDDTTFFDGDISAWDTSNVTNMAAMFRHSKVNRLPDNFNTSKVTNMKDMFEDSEITELPNTFNTSKVTNMKGMFKKSKIKRLPNTFNTSKVTNMKGMFASSQIKRLPDNFDTSKVTNMEGMFSVYDYTVNIIYDGYQLPGEIEEEQSTYEDSSQIKYLPESFDTSKVTSMRWMFYKNRKITSLPKSFNTSNVTDMESMFRDSIMEQIPWFNTSNVTIMINMFRDTQSFNQDISGWDVTKMNAFYSWDGSYIPWEGFNQDSSLEDSNIPENLGKIKNGSCHSLRNVNIKGYL